MEEQEQIYIFKRRNSSKILRYVKVYTILIIMTRKFKVFNFVTCTKIIPYVNLEIFEYNNYL